jgi:hypothetical protein
MEFDSNGATAETIREEAGYTGIRITLGGALSRAEIRLHVDVNVGDPIWPQPRQHFCETQGLSPPKSSFRAPDGDQIGISWAFGELAS